MYLDDGIPRKSGKHTPIYGVDTNNPMPASWRI
jgi:hypothetical protein